MRERERESSQKSQLLATTTERTRFGFPQPSSALGQCCLCLCLLCWRTCSTPCSLSESQISNFRIRAYGPSGEIFTMSKIDVSTSQRGENLCLRAGIRPSARLVESKRYPGYKNGKSAAFNRRHLDGTLALILIFNIYYS